MFGKLQQIFTQSSNNFKKALTTKEEDSTTYYTSKKSKFGPFQLKKKAISKSVFVSLHFDLGAPNNGFLSDPLKRYFRLSGVPLKLCRFILGCAIIFFICSVILGELESFLN